MKSSNFTNTIIFENFGQTLRYYGYKQFSKF